MLGLMYIGGTWIKEEQAAKVHPATAHEIWQCSSCKHHPDFQAQAEGGCWAGQSLQCRRGGPEGAGLASTLQAFDLATYCLHLSQMNAYSKSRTEDQEASIIPICSLQQRKAFSRIAKWPLYSGEEDVEAG